MKEIIERTRNINRNEFGIKISNTPNNNVLSAIEATRSNERKENTPEEQDPEVEFDTLRTEI
eukprot:snap_masked-scaffold_3-processed-gene-5.38-mRNA-1 protein AED:1.00 eAED:1.00 QI:0/0/0/0/1/1/2/0/61